MENVLDIPSAIKPVQIINPIDKKKYWVYNVSSDKPNYSQLKSVYSYKYGEFKRNGYQFCNVTMMAMGLIYSGIAKRFEGLSNRKYPELNRLPDKLAKFIFESSEVRNYYASRFPSLYPSFNAGKKDAMSPVEIHNILSWGTNLFYNVGAVTYFSTNVPWEVIIEDIIYNGTPVGISGKFSDLDHMLLVVGLAYSKLEDNDEPGKCQVPDYILVDDPFGKTYEYDKGLSGNDVWIKFEKCVQDFKPLDNPHFKFAHRFIKPYHLGI